MTDDMMTRLMRLARENGELAERVAKQDQVIRSLQERFARLTPEEQKKAANHELCLVLVMALRGIEDFEASPEEVAAVLELEPQLVFSGSGPDGKSMRVQLLPADKADAIVHPERRN